MSGALTRMLGHQAATGPSGPYGAHLYWELEIDANNGHSTTTAFSEFKFYDQSSTQITTSGGTAFSGGSGSDTGGVSNLFDGNNATSWNRSSATNTKCGYQFATAQAVASIDIFTSTSTNAAPKTCRLRYSDDGVTYTTAFEIWEPSWPASGNTTRTWPQAFTGGKHKAYRWNVTANGTGTRFTVMNEAEMHSAHGGADQTPNGVSFVSTTTTQDGGATLFDNSTSTHLDFDSSAGEMPGQVGYYFANTLVINEYSLTENFGTANGWKDFTFQYSDDGVTWTTLDTRSGVTWTTLPQTQTFSF